MVYLLEHIPLTDDEFNSPVTKLMTNVRKDLDGLLPWCLKAPSLKAAFAEGGPFSKDIIDTPARLWNKLRIHDITFGCDVLIDGAVLYESLNEWDKKVAESASKGHQYLCKDIYYSIYGPPKYFYNRSLYFGLPWCAS
jgi:hypothetical protein